MSTRKLYREDVYMKEADAHIVSVSPDNGGMSLVTLDQTIFFPAGGGQSCDRGTINGYPVLDVYEKSGSIYHLVGCHPEQLPCDSGPAVRLILDWDHRFDNMQRHCGEHIMSGVFYREYGGVNRGFHMGDQYMTLDISLEKDPAFTKITWEMAEHAELCANQVIWSNAPVTTRHFDSGKEAKRLPLRKDLTVDKDITIVSIGSTDDPADCVACCGTHPSTAGQVGLVKIFKVESNKGMFRIYMEAGQRAFRKLQQDYDTLTDLGSRLSAGPEDILKKYSAQQERNSKARSQLALLRKKAVQDEIDAVRGIFASQASAANVVRYHDILNTDDLLNVAKELFPVIPKVLFLVYRPENTILLCSCGNPDCGKLVRENVSVYNGKGGGNATSARAILPKEEYIDLFIDMIDKHLR